MTRNLGQTRLQRKRRAADPMRSYDSLPAPLRQWLSQAALPWSPSSVRRIWKRAEAKGLDMEGTCTLLNQSEINTLAREKRAIRQPIQATKQGTTSCHL